MDKSEAYAEKYKAKMKAVDADIKKLKAKAEEAKADAKLQYQDKLQEIKKMREGISKMVDEWKGTAKEKKKELEMKIDKKVADLGAAVEEVKTN